MKAILRKGMAACAAVLVSANVVAQNSVFIEKNGVNISGYVDLIPSEVIADKTSKLLLPLTEDAEISFVMGGQQVTEVQSLKIGYQVVNKNLEVEREFKMFTTDECLYTRLKIIEQLDAEGNWVEISKYNENLSPENFWYISANANCETSCVISQTLFNNDDKYEAIVPVYGGEFIAYNEDNSRRTIYKNYIITSLRIINETGETLYTLNAKENEFFSCYESDCRIVRIADKSYMVLPIGKFDANNGSWLYEIDSWRWYEICKETNSINFVRETRAAMNIAPTIADRDAQITITLNEENSNVARELVVTGVNGQLVECRYIPAGVNSVQIPASMLRSGMYNFTLQQKGQVVDNGKVIVK